MASIVRTETDKSKRPPKNRAADVRGTLTCKAANFGTVVLDCEAGGRGTVQELS